jgi:diguanylate cyclase (GGDEF)-like protein
MIDIDRFKTLNDTHGHEVGDRALIAVATALRDRLRAEDYIGRLGGEEFLALLPDTGEAEARRSRSRCGAARPRSRSRLPRAAACR